MKQTIMLSLFLLLFNTGVLAQPPAENALADNNASAHDTAELQGCLQRDQGFFMLVDRNNEYQRLSDNKSLKKLIGHEIKVTGKPAMRTIDTTPPGGASSAIEQRYIIVKTVQDVTPNCQAYGK